MNYLKDFNLFIFQTKYSNMTFIWTEISFLSLWWQSAHPTRKVNLKKLVEEGMQCFFCFIYSTKNEF